MILCAKKIREKFKLDEDFFRTDVKLSTVSAEMVMIKLNLHSQVVSAVACGSAHALLLTNGGLLYSMYVLLFSC